MWIKSRNVANTQRVFAQGSTGGGNNFSLQIISSGIRGIIGIDGGGQFVGTSASITSNTWYHVALVFGSSSLKLYINGVQQVSDTTTTTIGTSALATKMGIRADLATTEMLNGLIDEVRIYNRALGASEVKQLYNTGAKIKP